MKKHPRPASASNITAGHVRAFQAATTGIYGEATLWSCTVNGEQGVALVLVENAGENKLAVMPLFVAITESMKIEFEDGRRSGGGGGGRRPSDTREAFDVIKEHLTTPAPV